MLRQCNAHTDSFGGMEVSSTGWAREETSPGNRILYYGGGQGGLMRGEARVTYIGGV